MQQAGLLWIFSALPEAGKMCRRPSVVHLIDDTTGGGVMRVLEHIRTSLDMAELADHRIVTVCRGQARLRRYEADVVVSHLAISWRTLPSLLAIRFANRGKPIVHVEHSYTEGFVRHNVSNTRRFAALLRVGFSVFDAIVAVSHAQADWIRHSRFCPRHKLFTIQSCVDFSAFEGTTPPNSPVPKVFGAIGRLDHQKGFDILIEGFRGLPNPNISLRIYGIGDEFDHLETLADGDPRIQFKGFFNDPVRAYQDVDVVVVPSRWEAYGLVAIEALCANRTVLCADIDGLRDHKAYGACLFDACSAQEMTRELARALLRSPPARRPGSNGIRNDASRAFVSGWSTLLDTLMAKRGFPEISAVAASSRSFPEAAGSETDA